MPEAVIAEVKDLRVQFSVRHGRQRLTARAVDGVDLTIHEREILALVGESGCGKTTIARSIMRLQDITSGSVSIGGVDLTAITGSRLRRARRDFQMIFQDPFESLPPNATALDVVSTGLRIHRHDLDAAGRRAAAISALAACGLQTTAIADRRIFQLSGGQRQRVAIAAALAVEPRLLVADEPVSMLDVSMRADVLRLLLDLRERIGAATLFITHDLALAAVFADRVAVLYLGRVVEEGRADEVIERPRHPYTRALVEVMPRLGGARTGPRNLLAGEPPNPTAVASGCRFAPRCPLRRAMGEPQRCESDDPTMHLVNTDHRVACHFTDDSALPTAAQKPNH